MKKKKLIYLMGAGRSGTTLMASVLSESKEVATLGEMHQFLEFYLGNKNCSCGESLKDCSYWSSVINKLESAYSKEELVVIDKHNISIENHSNIIKSYFKKDDSYISFQEKVFQYCNEQQKTTYMLDSAKFISRALQLIKSKHFEVKIIYVVRDVRGVVNSFKKKVQTTKSPLSTILYYSFINYLALIVQFLLGKERVLKVKYEDFVESPIETLSKMGVFLNLDLSEVKSKIIKEESFAIPHIIGGNRLKTNKQIVLRKDEVWKENISKINQLFYYLLTLPLMLVNKYNL